MSDYTEIKLENGINILHKDSEITINFGNSTQTICRDFCSKPMLSPEHVKIAYINPYGWECIGELYIYNLYSKRMLVLSKDKFPNQHSVKKLEWLNEEQLLLIIGFGFGTASVGGDLYLFDSNSDRLKLIKKRNEKEEIKDFIIENNKLIIEIAVFDDNYNSYEVRSEQLTL